MIPRHYCRAPTVDIAIALGEDGSSTACGEETRIMRVIGRVEPDLAIWEELARFHANRRAQARHGSENMRRRNPIHCILPPGVLHKLAGSGSDEVRTAALATLELDHKFRMARAETASRRGGR